MTLAVDRVALAPDLSISRVLTGLWQIADMERDGRTLDLEPAARAMRRTSTPASPRSTWPTTTGRPSSWPAVFAHGSRARRVTCSCFTKWVPKPGPLDAGDVRAAVERSLQRLRTPAIDLLQFHAWNYADPSWLDALLPPADLQREGLIRSPRPDQRRRRAPATWCCASGIEVISNQVCVSLLDRRAAGALSAVCQARGVRCSPTARCRRLAERIAGSAQPEPDWERRGPGRR